MISAKHYTSTGEEKGTARLPEKLFGEAVNEHAMWLTVRNFLLNQRQGTAAVKNRKLVRGGGRKPHRQKGTGSARAGSRRSPLWVGGARAFGPIPRSYRTKLPKKVRQLALRSALSLAAKENRVVVIGDLSLEVPRTKTMFDLLSKVGVVDTKCLLVLGATERNIVLSGRNLSKLNITSVEQLSAYDLLNAEKLLITESALAKLGEASA
jgi:large subunit ribosomal protein L4